MSTKEIAKRLNEQGILCLVEYKKAGEISYSKRLAEEKAVWIQSIVRIIIRDERYTGKMVSNVRSCVEIGKTVMKNNPSSEWIVVEGTHEVIVDEIGTKEKEQEAMKQVQAELRTAKILTEYDPKMIGQIVEKVIVHVGGNVELVMRNRDSYEMVFGGSEEK